MSLAIQIMPISPIIKKFILTSLLSIFFCSTTAFSAEVLTIQPISFGGIIKSPFGGQIEIDARSGSATPVALFDGNSILDGNGYSGRIRIFFDRAYQSVTLIYPDSILLQKLPAGPETITMDNIAVNSMTSAMSTEEGELIDFYIGGRLLMNRDHNGLYEGIMTITVNLNNP